MSDKSQTLTSEEKKYLEHRDIEIKALFSKGASIESLCASFDLSEEEIKELLRKSVKVARKKHLDFRAEPTGKMDRLLRKIVKLCKQGKNSLKVSDVLGISHRDIKDIIREFDVKIYVPCKDCGELTDRTKRCWRVYCKSCAAQRQDDIDSRRRRNKYVNDPEYREKKKQSFRNYKANLVKKAE